MAVNQITMRYHRQLLCTHAQTHETSFYQTKKQIDHACRASRSEGRRRYDGARRQHAASATLAGKALLTLQCPDWRQSARLENRESTLCASCPKSERSKELVVATMRIVVECDDGTDAPSRWDALCRKNAISSSLLLMLV